MVAYSAGYHNAEKHIKTLVKIYGASRVQRYLQQISGDKTDAEAKPANQGVIIAGPLVEPHSGNPSPYSFNLMLDETSAVHIAEVILVKIYGKRVLEERPWDVKLNNGVYRIEGTQLGFANGQRAELGGVALIEIKQSNGEVVYFMHGK